MRPPTPLWGRLAERIAADSGSEPSPEPEARWGDEPEWKEVAPGISCKLLATDAAKERVSMLVRLAPGVAYPPHSHAGVEELHLLDGELSIDDRKLYPGDYNRAEPGTRRQSRVERDGLHVRARDVVHRYLTLTARGKVQRRR